MEGTGGFIDLTDKTDWYFIAIGKERAQRGEEGHGGGLFTTEGTEFGDRIKKPPAPASQAS
jgi:hypothetical protein